MGIADDILGPEEPANGKRSNGGSAYHGHTDSPFSAAKALDPVAVLTWLGVPHDGKRLTPCPSCGAEKGCDFVRGGWKCQHGSCADKGKNGFRTNVDSVVELMGVTPTEAVNALAEHFGTPRVEPKKAANDTHHKEPPPGRFDESEQSEEPPKTFQLSPVAQLLQPAIDRARARMLKQEKPVPVAHPERALNLGGGYWPGVHFVVAGTGAGKSLLVIEDLFAAAREGTPCLYIGLELEGFQVALRFLAEAAKVSWSKLYLGRCSEVQLDMAAKAIPSIENLPLYADFSGPDGWPISRLRAAVAALRAKHPDGPILVVLDYLQLVSAEPDDKRSELRERIGKAAYLGRNIAVEFNAAIVIVSSTARGNYKLLSGDAIKEAGIAMVPGGDDSFQSRKVVLNPDVLVGAGKEAGEIEASADSVTVLLRWPALLDGARIVLAVTAKGRATGASWCALVFDHGTRFVSFEVNDMDELPEPKKAGSSGSEPPKDIESHVIEVVRAHRGLKSRNEIEKLCTTNRQGTLAAIRKLIDGGSLVLTDLGWVVPVVPEPEDGNQ